MMDVNMTARPKKHGNNTPGQPNQSVRIDENWKKLLSSNLMGVKNSKVEDNKDHYTGVFRRARKKNNDITNNLNGLNKLNINNSERLNGVSKHDYGPSNSKKILSKEIKNKPLEKVNTTNVSMNNDKNVSKYESTQQSNIKPQNKLTKFIAMDCEMVGVGFEGGDHMLARVSLVNKFGDCIYDKFVKPREEVTDYRTKVSGIRKEDLARGENFAVVQKEVAEIIRGRILVGHSLGHDLSVLLLSHPKFKIRDTSKYKPFRNITKGFTPSLKRLAKEILGIDIQHGEHSSVEDAKAVMQIYCTVSKNWEQVLSQKRGYSRNFVET